MRALRALFIVALLLVAGWIAASGTYWYEAEDFVCLYHGGQAILTGHDPYDDAYWASVSAGDFRLPTFLGGTGTSPCPGRLGYPLWTAVAVAPLAALPLPPAATLWAALSIGAVVAGMAWSWWAVAGPRASSWLFAVLVVFSPMFWLLLISGQPTGIELGLAGSVAIALARRRSALAGIGLAAMLLKPQLVGVTFPAVVLRALARRRALALAAIASTAVMTLAALLFIPAWPLEWLGEVGGRRFRVLTLLPTAWGFAADVFGNAAAGGVLVAVLLLALAALLRGRHVSTLEVFVLSLPVSLFVTPYAWSYDHLVFAPGWAYALARARGDLAKSLTIACVAVVLPWFLYALAFTRGVETLTAVMPALNAILVAFAIRWPERVPR